MSSRERPPPVVQPLIPCAFSRTLFFPSVCLCIRQKVRDDERSSSSIDSKKKVKFAVILDEKLTRLGGTTGQTTLFASWSQAIQEAIEEKFAPLERHRLVRECTKIGPGILGRLSG